MSAKTKNAYMRDQIMFAFVGENCPDINVSADLIQQYNDYKESLDEINAMIQYAQDINDTNEVAAWRRMLMHNKMVMRELKEQIKMMNANNTSKEIVYS